MAVFYLLTYLVCFCYVLLMLAYLIGWIKTPARLLKLPTSNSPKESLGTEFQTKVSVIIPARNEEKNILNCLSSLYRQTCPVNNFEIIVVDDHSSDRTAEFIYQLDIPNLKLIQLSENKKGKKQALAEGIKNAGGNLIITTDADCEAGEKWISSIVSFYEKEKPKMIVAPVLLANENSLSEIFQSQEMTVLTASAGASLYYNLPILCSGANLIYEKEAFISVNGFEGVERTATGDDIFLMLKMNKKFPKQIAYLKSTDAVVFTRPKKHSPDAWKQRKRWASKTFHYGFSPVMWVAVLVFLANFFILLSVILSIINVKFVPALITALPIKCMVDYMLYHSASSFFRKRNHPLIFVLASCIYPVYAGIIGLISPFTNYSWKGRTS